MNETTDEPRGGAAAKSGYATGLVSQPHRSPPDNKAASSSYNDRIRPTIGTAARDSENLVTRTSWLRQSTESGGGVFTDAVAERFEPAARVRFRRA